jgi:hypothetical protein
VKQPESKKPVPKKQIRRHKMPKILYTEFVGIDVSKDTLDVYETKNNQYFTVKNDKKGIRSLFNIIKRNPTQLVLIDLTGGYEKEVTSLLDLLHKYLV